MAITSDIQKLRIAGYPFILGSSTFEGLFLAYQDGIFFKVADAYELGSLTSADIAALYEACYQGNCVPFEDVAPTAWYYDAVRYAYLSDLFQGVSESQFAPDKTMTRAMLVTVLWRTAGRPIVNKEASFTDLEENAWVSRNTDEMIPSLLNELSPEAVMVNALLFQGQWSDPYGEPMDDFFYVSDGHAQPVRMLRSTETTYLHDDKATGFLKPFIGSKYAFAVIVPNTDVSLDDYLEGLDGEALRAMLKGERYDAVYTAMPEFKVEASTALPESLKKLGITDAFSSTLADLSGIAPDLVVSDAIHRAVVDVTQDGVSAAAATAIMAEPACADDPPEKIARVTADRPYLYMIVDTTTKLPLFIGTNVAFE